MLHSVITPFFWISVPEARSMPGGGRSRLFPDLHHLVGKRNNRPRRLSRKTARERRPASPAWIRGLKFVWK